MERFTGGRILPYSILFPILGVLLASGQSSLSNERVRGFQFPGRNDVSPAEPPNAGDFSKIRTDVDLMREQLNGLLQVYSYQRQQLNTLEHLLVQGRPPMTSQRLVSVELNVTLLQDGGNCITGIAVLNNLLYVGRGNQPEVKVYDVKTLTLKRRLRVPGLGCVKDLAASTSYSSLTTSDGVLYVSDSCNRAVHVLDEHGVRTQWSVMGSPHGLSVTKMFNVLVTMDDVGRLTDVTLSETSKTTTSAFNGVDFCVLSNSVSARHALEIVEGWYAVVHGLNTDAGLHRVCIVDRNGRVLQSFGGERGSSVGLLNTPVRLATYGGVMVVADHNNFRLLLFDISMTSSLSYVREVLSTRDTAGVNYYPGRLALSPDGSQMFMTYDEWNSPSANNTSWQCNSGHVRAFRLDWL